MSPFEIPDTRPKPWEQPAPAKQEDLKLQLNQAVEKKESRESLNRLGNLLYRNFQSREYSPAMVLSAIREVYDKHQNGFNPKLGFNDFIKSFGPGMVKLCQLKLVAAGGFDLGRFGERKTGIDGKLGKMTAKALARYYGKEMGRASQTPSRFVSRRKPGASAPTRTTSVSTPAPEPAPMPTDDVRGRFDQPSVAPEKARVSPKSALEPRMLDIYNRTPNTFRTDDLPEYFGNTREAIEPYIVNEDPVALTAHPPRHQPLTFLDRTIADPHAKGKKGVNMMIIPFLKIVEEKMDQLKIKYRPAASQILGFEFRGMKVGGKETKTLSSHAFGLAIDIDPNQNGPKDGRGNIPDQLAMAMVESGFAWGLIGSQDYRMLGADPMHFQLRFPPDSAEGQAIINSSPAGRKYWAAIAPMLAEIKNHA